MDLPCGCAERKEIMFTHGQPDKATAIIAGLAVVGLVAAIIYVKGR